MEKGPGKRPARRVVRDGVMRLSAPPERVFPLLCPVREYDWIDGWDCEMVWSDSGLAEDGCIFVTSFPGEEDEVWTFTRRDPEGGLLEFVRFLKDERAIRANFVLRACGVNESELRWTMTITSLGPRGEALLMAYGEAEHARMVENMGRMLNHYFATGEKLPRQALSG